MTLSASEILYGDSFRTLLILDLDGKIVVLVQYRDVMNSKHIFFE